MRRLRLVDKATIYARAAEKQVSFSFFESTKNALITSIFGKEAEASRMSGGDYDGDRAWICWNKDLLACLPNIDVFLPEDTSSLYTLPSDLESKLWSQCGPNELIQYMLNFRHHFKILGEFVEHLDCFIDFYGFNDQRTRELGRAAFLQVSCFSLMLCKCYPFLTMVK